MYLLMVSLDKNDNPFFSQFKVETRQILIATPLQSGEFEVDPALSNIPQSIGKLKHLEWIVLHHSNIIEFPEEFCLLQSLKTLVIREDTALKIKSLLECFGNLTNLWHIDVSWCSNLDTLSVSIGNLTNLWHIDLCGCSKLDTLSDSFRKLIKLQYLYLWDCDNLTMSSGMLGNISTLQVLNLNSCKKIEVFPGQVAH